jgi:hypothetical protein
MIIFEIIHLNEMQVHNKDYYYLNLALISLNYIMILKKLRILKFFQFNFLELKICNVLNNNSFLIN